MRCDPERAERLRALVAGGLTIPNAALKMGMRRESAMQLARRNGITATPAALAAETHRIAILTAAARRARRAREDAADKTTDSAYWRDQRLAFAAAGAGIFGAMLAERGAA